MSDDIPDYSGEEVPPDPDALLKLQKLCREMAVLKLREVELEAELEKIEAQLEVYEQNHIPMLMKSLQLDELKTASGLKVILKEDVIGSLPQDEERRARAFQYLHETGNQGLIRSEFTISYGVGSSEWAESFAQELERLEVSRHADVKQEQTINHQSMLKFLRDQIADGLPVNLKDFGCFTQMKAKIDLNAKKRKSRNR